MRSFPWSGRQHEGEKAQVDVIIPAHNAGAFIAETIASVARQTRLPAKVIVVDDGSTDDTAAVVYACSRQYPQLGIRLVSQRNAGVAAARNSGLRVATAPFVALLDADDLWEPAKLERQLDLMLQTAGERTGLIYCDYRVVDEHGKSGSEARHIAPLLKGNAARRLMRGNLVSGSASAVLLRAEALHQVGLFDEELPVAEDWDMWLRISRQWEFDFVPEPLVCIRQHTQSMQRNRRKMVEGELRLACKLWGRGQLSLFYWAGLTRRLQRNSVTLAALKLPPSQATPPLLFWPPLVRTTAAIVSLAIAFRRLLMGGRKA